MNQALVSIIIVNYNGKEMLNNCLKSIEQTSYAPCEIIVVDNASKDDSCPMVKNQFPQVKLIELKSNLGYSKGNNIGIKNSSGEFIVLLNNDTIVTPMWINELIKEAKKQPQKLYQPKILFMNTKQINSLGNAIQLFGFAFPTEICSIDQMQFDGVYPAGYASGACIFTSRSLLQKVGLFDEDDLFSYYEDVNLGWRCLLMGYTSCCVASAVIYHKWGGSFGNRLSKTKFFLLERARLATLLKNYSIYTLVCILPAILLIEAFVFIYSLQSGVVSKKILTYSDLIKSRKVLAAQRKQLSLVRKNSDGLIIQYFTDEIYHPYLGNLRVSVNKVLSSLSRKFRFFIR